MITEIPHAIRMLFFRDHESSVELRAGEYRVHHLVDGLPGIDGDVNLQQEHLSETVGHLWLVVRTAADVQRRWCCGPDQFVQPGRIPCPAVLGKPGKVRLVWLFRYYVAGGVNEP